MQVPTLSSFPIPKRKNNFVQHIQKLCKDCLPEGSLEEETFRRYVTATFQVMCAQALELQARDCWVHDLDHLKWFSQMERFINLGVLQERRADKALNERRKLQRDRFATFEVQGEIYGCGKEVNFSKAPPWPTSEHRSSTEPASA